jgi:hypothetical protein
MVAAGFRWRELKHRVKAPLGGIPAGPFCYSDAGSSSAARSASQAR